MNTAQRIKKIREFRDYKQSYMADKMNIAQSTYSDMENGTTRLTTEKLEQIAGILEVPVEAFWESESKVFNIDNNHIEKFYIEHLHEENKEIFQKSFEMLREQLEVFKSQNEALLKALEKFAGRK